VTWRIGARPEEPARTDEERARPAPPAPEQVLDLQRSAGNAAVARVLAREPAAPAFSPFAPAAGAASPIPKLPAALVPAVDKYLLDQRGSVRMEVAQGTISLPELTDRIRRNVPEAAGADAFALSWHIGDVYMGDPAVPATRGKSSLGGDQAQQQAKLANLFPSPPTSVTFGASKTAITIGIGGAEVKTRKDGTGVTAKADQDGADVEAKRGGVSVGASGKWDGSSFGLRTEVSGVKFSGKVERAGESWKWSAGLVIPLAGDEIDELPDVTKVVDDTRVAVEESVDHVRSGGSPTDGYVTTRMAKVKPAIGAAGRIAKRADKPSATLRATASGEGGGFTAGVSLVIEF
jgi:hypothetical protein